MKSLLFIFPKCTFGNQEKWFPNVVWCWHEYTQTVAFDSPIPSWSEMYHPLYQIKSSPPQQGRIFRQPNSMQTDLTEAIQPSHTHSPLLALRSASCTKAVCVYSFSHDRPGVEKFIAVHFRTRRSLLQSWSPAKSKLRRCALLWARITLLNWENA